MSVEQDHLDVLQNIEAAIQGVYRANNQLLDYDVEAAINALILEYQHEAKGHPQATPGIQAAGLKQTVYQAVWQIVEYRLGREPVAGLPNVSTSGAIDLETALACLKRIRKSIQMWTKKEGRQGYLNFAREFLP